MNAPINIIGALQSRLAKHDGCSRFGPDDLRLLNLSAEIETSRYEAIKKSKRALAADDSNDDIRDSLLALLEALGEGELPDCTCAGRTTEHAAACPLKAWEVA